MNVYLTAMLGTYDEFCDVFRPGDEESIDVDRPLLGYALGNTNVDARYHISLFLLDRDVSCEWVTKDLHSPLHLVLGHTRQNLSELVDLCRRLIEGGADVNVLDSKSVDALQLIGNLKYSDADLVELYDLWFTQDLKNIEVKNRYGYSPLDLARKVPYRQDLVTRMECYLDR
jgi:uncharacterized protein